MRNRDKNDEGVFPFVWNQAAFIDVVTVNVSGTRRTRSDGQILNRQNLAIGGVGRYYGRCIRGCDAVTGNDLQLKYSPLRNYTNLSPFVLTVWAGRGPVTCANVLLVLDSFMRRGYKATISKVELTFDTSEIPLYWFTRDLCTRAQIREEFNERDGTSTLYAGGTRSPWELRIYKKTSVVRVEFILRSGFFRRQRIRTPEDLLRLRKANLWRCVSFREVDQSNGDKLPARIKIPWTWLGHGLPPADLPPSVLLKTLRKVRVDPKPFIVKSPREVLLRRMLKNLIW
jgi:hypothetical protein